MLITDLNHKYGNRSLSVGVLLVSDQMVRTDELMTFADLGRSPHGLKYNMMGIEEATTVLGASANDNTSENDKNNSENLVRHVWLKVVREKSDIKRWQRAEKEARSRKHHQVLVHGELFERTKS
ncbi:unnamed protein product [Auanema sp. JU1783]|nr:unnamed protein product [Auanema sp. JU1783]